MPPLETNIIDHPKNNLGTSLGINLEMREINTIILDHQGSSTGTSTNLGIPTERTLKTTRGTLGRVQEEETGVTIVKKMTIGNSKEATTLKSLVTNIETSLGRIREMTTLVTTQEMTRDQGTGNHPEVDMRKGDRGRGARALEDRGRGVTAPEMVGVVDMITGEVMLAMGADAEKVARRP